MRVFGDVSESSLFKNGRIQFGNTLSLPLSRKRAREFYRSDHHRPQRGLPHVSAPFEGAFQDLVLWARILIKARNGRRLSLIHA